MSALPPIADICSALAHVRFGPKADIEALLNRLGEGREKRGRHNQTKRFRC